MSEITPKQQGTSEIVSKDHYNYQIQLLIDAFNRGILPEVEGITVEPRYGHVASIDYHSSASRIIYGYDAGFNTASSKELAKDKGYSKFILRHLGIHTPKGEEFLLPWWANTLRESERQRNNTDIKDTSQADAYIRSELEYPVYTKPVNGSQGTGVHKIHDKGELEQTFEVFNQERVKVALIEEALNMPDYRLLAIDGKLISAYERRPLSVVGDGEKTILDLIHDKNELYKALERDIKLEHHLSDIRRFIDRNGLTLSDIVPFGADIRLLDVSNLSAGGTPYDVTEKMNPRWEELAARIAEGFNLRICGVDLACEDITSATSDYSVVEVNATPGVRHFMSAGEESRKKIENMFISLFRTPS